MSDWEPSAFVAVAADPLLSAAKEMQEALQFMRDSFMSMTQWSGEPPTCVVRADAALAKSRGEQ